MERIWLKQYPAGVPADIDVTQYTSLVELLEESFAKFSARKAFICMDKSITYRDLDDMSLALAAYLQSKGLQKGARVALMMPNVLPYPVSTAAVLRAGYAVVNVNPLFTPRELEHQLKDSGAEAIIVLENFAKLSSSNSTSDEYCVTSISAGTPAGYCLSQIRSMVFPLLFRCQLISRFLPMSWDGTPCSGQY